jgi:hypothetical protein
VTSCAGSLIRGPGGMVWHGMAGRLGRVSLALFFSIHPYYKPPPYFDTLQHIWVWGWSTLTGLIAIVFDAFHPLNDELECWYSDPKWRLMSVVPLVIYISFAIFLAIYTIQHLRSMGKVSIPPFRPLHYMHNTRESLMIGNGNGWND